MVAESYRDLTAALDEPYERPRRAGTQASSTTANRRTDVKRDATRVLAYGEEADRLATEDDDSHVTVGSGVFHLGTSKKGELDEERSLVERVRDERLAFLARRQEGASSREDDARYLLLTERLRRLDPRFTDAERQLVSRALDTVEQASELLASVKARFGM
jgi:hypothetical protein